MPVTFQVFWEEIQLKFTSVRLQLSSTWSEADITGVNCSSSVLVWQFSINKITLEGFITNLKHVFSWSITALYKQQTIHHLFL